MMVMAYQSNPDLLAMDLEILFEPCTDPTFAVLHNAAIGKIRALCGQKVIEHDEVGVEIRNEYVLDCKESLAKHLAMSVLRYARMQ
jgi:hypothetical protein